MVLRDVAQTIIDSAIRSSLPDEAVKRALKNCHFEKKVHLVAIGKAAWQMARAAVDCIGSQIQDGIVITKYGHIKKETTWIAAFLKQGIRCRMKTPAGRPNRLSRWSALWEKKTLCCSWFRAEDRHCLKSR